MSLNIMQSVAVDNRSIFDRISSRSTNLRANSQSITPEIPGARQGSSEVQKLDNVLFNALNKVLPNDGTAPIQGQIRGDLTPQSVADRVISHVSRALNQAKIDGANQASLEQLFAEAQSGISSGIKQAREALSAISTFQADANSGQINRQVDETASMIQKGLSALSSHLFNSGEVTAAGITQKSVGAELTSSKSFSFDVETNDGDIISIKINDTKSFSSMSYSDTDGVSRTESNMISSSNYSMSIEGDLDDGELEAIEKLVHNVDELAEKFFDGDLQRAFQKANQLELDSDELASFNVSFEMMQAKKVSSVYQSVAALGDNQRSPMQNDSTPDLSRTSDFLQDMDRSMKLPEMHDLFKEADQIFKQLFENAVRINADAEHRLDEGSDGSGLGDLKIEDMMSLLFGDTGDDDHDHDHEDKNDRQREKEVDDSED